MTARPRPRARSPPRSRTAERLAPSDEANPAARSRSRSRRHQRSAERAIRSPIRGATTAAAGARLASPEPAPRPSPDSGRTWTRGFRPPRRRRRSDRRRSTRRACPHRGIDRAMPPRSRAASAAAALRWPDRDPIPACSQSCSHHIERRASGFLRSPVSSRISPRSIGPASSIAYSKPCVISASLSRASSRRWRSRSPRIVRRVRVK